MQLLLVDAESDTPIGEIGSGTVLATDTLPPLDFQYVPDEGQPVGRVEFYVGGTLVSCGPAFVTV